MLDFNDSGHIHIDWDWQREKALINMDLLEILHVLIDRLGQFSISTNEMNECQDLLITTTESNIIHNSEKYYYFSDFPRNRHWYSEIAWKYIINLSSASISCTTSISGFYP